jgi:uncharacterized repeat protein (TIGR03803 family)
MKTRVRIPPSEHATPLRGVVGLLLGIVILLPALSASAGAQAQSYSAVYDFCQGSNSSDGENPFGDLIADSAGNLYGTTEYGGTYNYGTVFKVSVDGTETVLHSFAGQRQADGAVPSAGLVMDAAGNLYGTTFAGGALGAGTVFEISAQGSESVLYSFTGGKDEGEPLGSLTLDSKGNLYGTTTGATDPEIYYGTVFKLAASGKITELHTFAGPPNDGALPYSGLVHDTTGNFYGTTFEGGAYEVGTVFELSRAGAETVLYNFTGGSDGAAPYANLLPDGEGNLYGTATAGGSTTSACGPFVGCGTVFELNPSGEETVLYAFTGAADGAVPLSDLLMDSKGDLYGTALAGGSSACDEDENYPGCGVVFELTAAGKEKVLHTFTGYQTSDGALPSGGLLRVGSYLYGTTYYGGTSNCGIVYKVAP